MFDDSRTLIRPVADGLARLTRTPRPLAMAFVLSGSLLAGTLEPASLAHAEVLDGFSDVGVG